MSITEHAPAAIPRRYLDGLYITANRKNEFYLSKDLHDAMDYPERLTIGLVSSRTVYVSGDPEGKIKVDHRRQISSRHLWRMLGRPEPGTRFPATILDVTKSARISKTPMKEQEV